MTRSNMHFVPQKSEKQQAILSIHRARSGFVKARTAQANAMRGLLSEFGIAIPVGITVLRCQIPEILASTIQQATTTLPSVNTTLMATPARA